MHTISPQVEREFISTYDQAINTGIQKGMQQVALSMLKEGSSEKFTTNK